MSRQAAEGGRQGLPEGLAGALEHQAQARLVLGAALAGRPAHAYLFEGPRGSGKRQVARAFAAELLVAGAPDPADARRRAMLDPSPHPDLAWVGPRGARLVLVDDVRDQVIRQAAYRPFEGERRVFVIDAAETMNDEGQNALLKTLEEPAPFAHLILLASEPDRLAETIASRCQRVRFAPLSVEVVQSGLGGGPEAAAAARLARGDAARARGLLEPAGRRIREQAEACARSARAGRCGEAPWRSLLEGAETAGREAAGEVEAELEAELESIPKGREATRVRRENEERAKRALRRERTAALELGLDLCGAWFRDLAVTAEGAAELAYNSDRVAELAEDAEGLEPARALAAFDLVGDTRLRLERNVSEELALEALFYRLEDLLG